MDVLVEKLWVDSHHKRTFRMVVVLVERRYSDLILRWGPVVLK